MSQKRSAKHTVVHCVEKVLDPHLMNRLLLAHAEILVGRAIGRAIGRALGRARAWSHSERIALHNWQRRRQRGPAPARASARRERGSPWQSESPFLPRCGRAETSYRSLVRSALGPAAGDRARCAAPAVRNVCGRCPPSARFYHERQRARACWSGGPGLAATLSPAQPAADCRGVCTHDHDLQPLQQLQLQPELLRQAISSSPVDLMDLVPVRICWMMFFYP
eukprot:SAG11_NODE_9256_length_928_cov_0.990350_1_plen_222_part_00